MNTFKKLAVGISAAALLLGSALPVFGAAETSNTDITDHSYAQSVAYDNDHMVASEFNSGVTFANIDIGLANSGFNDQSGNEDENMMETSGATADWETANFANVNETEFGESSGAKASNARVDDHSGDVAGGAPAGPVYAYANDSDNFTVSNSNVNTNLLNVTASVANSGLNDQNDNEDDNTMETGSAASAAGTENYVNVNETVVDVGGGAQASNDDVDDHSSAVAIAQDNDTVNVSNVNSTTSVVNVSASVANSGGNSQSGNEDGNSMKTGSATATGSTTNVVNANQTSVE